MKSFFSKLFGTKNYRPASNGHHARLNVEALEERSLMSASPMMHAIAQAPIAPTMLAVTTQPPSSVTTGCTFGLSVTAEDNLGHVATNFNGNVTLALLNNPGGSVLSGTLTEKAVNGVATFSGLSLNKAGTGYQLRATSGALNSATSSGFNETAIVSSSVVHAREEGDYSYDDYDYDGVDDGDDEVSQYVNTYVPPSTQTNDIYYLPVPSSAQVSQYVNTYVPPSTQTSYPIYSSALQNPNGNLYSLASEIRRAQGTVTLDVVDRRTRTVVEMPIQLVP